jgi:hypothetical protein
VLKLIVQWSLHFVAFGFSLKGNHFNFNEILVPLAGFMYVFGQ